MVDSGALPRGRGEAGVGALEYVGTLVVAAVLVVAVAMSVGVGDRVLKAVEVAVCEILGGENCGARTTDITEALPSCEVYTQGYDLHGQATVFSVNVGGSGKLTLKQDVAPDGAERWLVQESVGAQVGAHAMLGQEGKFGASEALSVEGKALITGEGGRAFAFDSEAQARDYMSAAAQQVGKEVAATASPLPRAVDVWVADMVTRTSYDQPGKPESYYAEIGSQVTAGVNASAVGAGASLSAAGADAFGVKYEPGADAESDQTTVYYKGTQELAGQLQVLGRGPDGKLQGEVVVAVTMQDGEPLSAKIEAAGKVRSGFFAVGGMDVPLGGKLPRAATAIGFDGGEYVQGKVAFEMDLTRPGNLDAVADVTQSTGMDLFPGHGTPDEQDPAEAVGGLRDRFTKGGPVEGATITGQLFEGSESRFEVGFFAGDLLAFGAGGHVGTTTSRATDAFYYAPGSGFVQWQGCDGQ